MPVQTDTTRRQPGAWCRSASAISSATPGGRKPAPPGTISVSMADKSCKAHSGVILSPLSVTKGVPVRVTVANEYESGRATRWLGGFTSIRP